MHTPLHILNPVRHAVDEQLLARHAKFPAQLLSAQQLPDAIGTQTDVPEQNM
jgi:hypothetical protein